MSNDQSLKKQVGRSAEPSATTFLEAGGFEYRVYVHEAPIGSIHVRIASRWADAKEAQAEQTCLRLNLRQKELRKLIAGLQAAL